MIDLSHQEASIIDEESAKSSDLFIMNKQSSEGSIKLNIENLHNNIKETIGKLT